VTISVVIPNWNGRRFLERCLFALRRQTVGDVEVVLVDNASSDDSVELVRRSFPEVEVVQLTRNAGFAAAMNAGIRRARGSYIAFLNNDTEPDERWLQELLACLERHPRAASATSKVLLFDRPGTLDDTGNFLTPSLLPYARGHGEADARQFDVEEEVFSASGAAALWRADALAKVGLFDESFFAYYEDVDLGFRARLAGYECWYAPRAVVLHERGGTGGDDGFTLYHHVRNRWLMLAKDAPAGLLARRLPRLAAGELTWWVRAARGAGFRPLLRAYVDAAKAAPRVRAERRRIQRGREVEVAKLEGLLGPRDGAQSRRRASDQ
jgi:GT2 family glycosyltransferase